MKPLLSEVFSWQTEPSKILMSLEKPLRLDFDREIKINSKSQVSQKVQ